MFKTCTLLIYNTLAIYDLIVQIEELVKKYRPTKSLNHVRLSKKQIKNVGQHFLFSIHTQDLHMYCYTTIRST